MVDRTGLSDHRRGALTALPATPDNAPVRLTPIGFRALLNLRCPAEDTRTLAAVRDVLGVSLPGEPNRVAAGDERTAMWLGPDEWLIVAADGEEREIEHRLRAVVSDKSWLSVVDVSHNYTGLALAGPAALDVLAKGCPLDLHRGKFRPGDCAQTVLAGTRVLLHSIERTDSIELWVRNSFARYATQWLLDAMAEFPESPAPEQ